MACAADILLSFLQSIIHNPLHVLRKDMTSSRQGTRTSELSRTIPPAYRLTPGEKVKVYREGDYFCFISDFQEDNIYVQGKVTKLLRVFVNFALLSESISRSGKAVQEKSTHAYTNVGWIVNSDIGNCMVCMVEFGIFTYPHHCKACGNVVCQKCSNEKVVIEEVKEIGRPLRVCVQCFFGQEVVNCIQHKTPPPPPVPKVEEIKVEVAPPQLAGDDRLLQQQKSEEQQRKMEEQQRFLSEAMRRQDDDNLQSRKPRRKESIFGMSEVYGRDSNDFAVTTADDVDVTYTDLYTSGENAMDFDSIYNSPQSPDRIVAADEIALADDDDVKNQQRLMHIASFGPIRIVKPTPSFVMKTKRHSGTKIFVNVCTHDFVPFKVMDSGAMNSNNVFTYMVVSAPLEHTNEKDSSYCVVYDVVVNAKVVSVSSSDESGRARAMVCTQALDLISRQFKEEMDTQYKILRVSNNYKGMSEYSDSSPVRSCAVPDEKAFHSLHQLFITPTDVEVINSVKEAASPAASKNRNSNPKKNARDVIPPAVKPVPPMVATTTRGALKTSSAAGEIILSERDQAQPPASALSRLVTSRLTNTTTTTTTTTTEPRDSSVTLGGDAIVYERGNYLEVGSTKSNNLNSVIKTIVKPLSECHVTNLSFNNNFNDVLNDLKRYEYEYNDMILKPQAGYVIATRRFNKGQKIFVNVCHHKKVGLLTATQSGLSEYTVQLASDGSLRDNNFPYIIGSINKLFSHHLVRNGVATSSSSGKADPATVAAAAATDSSKIVAVTIDVVIPSSLWTLMIESDVTGDIRENVSVRLLENLTAQTIQFESSFDLPIIKGGYVSCNDGAILPVINLSEAEKSQFRVSFVGQLAKQGHGVKSWKDRLVHIMDSRMYYFDTTGTNKGDFHIDHCLVQSVPRTECSAPERSFAFKVVNCTDVGSDYLYCHVQSEELRQFFALVLLCRARQISIKRDLSRIPERLRGWLKKQGHIIKSWKKRFFVLADGQLKYFENDPRTDGRSGEKPLGQVDLIRSDVKVIINSRLLHSHTDDAHDCKIVVTSDGGRELIMQTDDVEDKKKWFDAIKLHIHYANGFDN